MNIFLIDENPGVAARQLCREHRNKMIIESCQLLATTVRLLRPDLEEEMNEFGIVKNTHVNHPSRIWVGQSKSNFHWLLRHLRQLLYEYGFRKETSHKLNVNYLYFQDLFNKGDLLSSFLHVAFTDVLLAMPVAIKEKYGTLDSNGRYSAPLYTAVKAYREYYCTKVFKPNTKYGRENGIYRRPTWDEGCIPDWYVPLEPVDPPKLTPIAPTVVDEDLLNRQEMAFQEFLANDQRTSS